MAKPRAWVEGQLSESAWKEKAKVLKTLFPRVLECIQNNPTDFPHVTDIVQTKIRAILEDTKKVEILSEIWFFQNTHSMLESLLQTAGFQDNKIVQDLFFAFNKVLRQDEVK